MVHQQRRLQGNRDGQIHLFAPASIFVLVWAVEFVERAHFGLLQSRPLQARAKFLPQFVLPSSKVMPLRK